MDKKIEIWLRFLIQCDHIRNRDHLAAYFFQECTLNPDLRDDFFVAVENYIQDCDLEEKKIASQKYFFCISELLEGFGWYDTKCDLDDLYFSLHFPDEYANILILVDEKLGDYTHKLQLASNKMKELAQEKGIQIETKYRRKNLMSIYRKMLFLNKTTLESVYDLIGMRIIVLSNKIKDCYTMLEQIHDEYKPKMSRYKDYISIPKVNEYQAIHTNVSGLYDKTDFGIEIQIKTSEMELQSSYGKSSHVQYKNTLSGVNEQRGFRGSGYDTPELEFHRSKTIYIITKDDDIMSIPSGTNLIQFADIIHSQLAAYLTGADVNGEFQPPSYILQEGDRVQLLRHPTKKQFLNTSHDQ